MAASRWLIFNKVSFHLLSFQNCTLLFGLYSLNSLDVLQFVLISIETPRNASKHLETPRNASKQDTTIIMPRESGTQSFFLFHPIHQKQHSSFCAPPSSYHLPLSTIQNVYNFVTYGCRACGKPIRNRAT